MSFWGFLVKFSKNINRFLLENTNSRQMTWHFLWSVQWRAIFGASDWKVKTRFETAIFAWFGGWKGGPEIFRNSFTSLLIDVEKKRRAMHHGREWSTIVSNAYKGGGTLPKWYVWCSQLRGRIELYSEHQRSIIYSEKKREKLAHIVKLQHIFSKRNYCRSMDS